MPHVLTIHEVEAYPAWKAVFDHAADIRKHAGEISYQLLRYADLVEITRKAGVKAPSFIYLHEIERGVL